MTPAAPTKADRPFHNIKEAYAHNALTKGIEAGSITTEDEGLITAFIDELKASNGICTSRANKLTYILIRWRQYIGPYSSNVIAHLYSGVSTLKAATVDGEPYSQNTLRDYITTLKRFYLWLIENGISTVPADKVRKIKPPAWDTMTKTASQLLTEEEVVAMLNACFTSRDRALISMLYEGGFRVKELGTLTWEQVTFDDHGLIVNVNMKTEKPRYVRLVASAPLLAQWKNDYPCAISPQGLVFISNLRRPLKYDSVNTQLKKIAARAGIQKTVTPHLFRHTRITMMHRQRYHESVIKQMMWGNQSTKMMATYTHLTDEDIDAEVLRANGIERPPTREKQAMKARQCVHCMAINSPVSRFCGTCGQPLTEEAAVNHTALMRLIEGTPEYQHIMQVVAENAREMGEI